jgi:hypothetical protein
MTNHKYSRVWVPVYDGNGKHVATMNANGECKSLGYSPEDSPPEVVVEIRAAELVEFDVRQDPDDYSGYLAHLNGTDPPPSGLAGWLEREILLHDEPDRPTDAIARPGEDGQPAPEWQKRVFEKCDEVDREAASGLELAMFECERTGRGVPVANEACDLDGPAHAEPLDAIDQSDPTPAPEVPLHDVHSDEETTHVGAVDDRFDRTEGL